MNYIKELKRINDKYYPLIKSEYGKYIKNFDKIPNLTQNVFLLTDEECVGEHEDLLRMRGKCLSENGDIYIRKSKFNEHVLVHEFIHRISRNKKKVNLFRRRWEEGIGFEIHNVDYNGLNELFTEWLAYAVTKIDEPTVYQKNLYVIDWLIDERGGGKESAISAFFRGDEGFFFDVISFKLALKKQTEVAKCINEISKITTQLR